MIPVSYVNFIKFTMYGQFTWTFFSFFKSNHELRIMLSVVKTKMDFKYMFVIETGKSRGSDEPLSLTWLKPIECKEMSAWWIIHWILLLLWCCRCQRRGFLKNLPFRIKNCPLQTYLMSERNKMNKPYGRPYIDASCQASFNLAL